MGCRSNRATPKSRSISWMLRVITGWLMPNCRPAARRLPLPLSLVLETVSVAGLTTMPVWLPVMGPVPAVGQHTEAILAEIEADAAAIVAAVETATPTAGSTTAQSLSEHHRAILDFERRWWRQPGAKEQAIRDNFEMSPTRYYQTLNALLDLPQALTYDPSLVNRLQRLRSAAARGRRLR